MSKSSMTTLCSRPYNSFRSTHGVSCSLKQHQQNTNVTSPGVTHAFRTTKLHSTAAALIKSSQSSSSNTTADNNNNTAKTNKKATTSITEAVADNKKYFSPKKTTTVWSARSSLNQIKNCNNTINTYNTKNNNNNNNHMNSSTNNNSNMNKYRIMTNNNNNNNKIDTKRLSSSTSSSMCAVHSNSPNSGTSLESIVPKYQKNISYANTNGANKRSIITKPQKRSYNTSAAFNKINHNSSLNNNTNRKIVTLTVEGRFAKKCKEKDAKDMRSPFSDKFPMGLPFEDEFYRPSKRSSSIHTTTSSYIDRNSSCSSSVIYEDEFNRKPSCEPLYVDFSKTISSDAIHDYHNESYYKFERVSKYYSGNMALEREEPAVYLAVASWIPRCNQIRVETKKMDVQEACIEFG